MIPSYEEPTLPAPPARAALPTPFLNTVSPELLAWAESLGQKVQDLLETSEVVKGPALVSQALRTKLADMVTALEAASNQDAEHRQFIAQVTAGSGIALSAGFITWLLRGGSLLASLLASMPAWRYFDPIPS